MLRVRNIGFGAPHTPPRFLTKEERDRIPWDQCTEYRPEHWEPNENPLPDGEIWIKIPATDLSPELQHVTDLFFEPIEERVTAVLLGLHSRVGEASSLRVLDHGCVQVILGQLWL